MGYQINKATIKAMVPQDEILAQMAEEASELTQACLKLRRCLRKDNPTPVSKEAAIHNLLEEWADVMLCYDLLENIFSLYPAEIENEQAFKAQRWVDRMQGVQQAAQAGDPS